MNAPILLLTGVLMPGLLFGMLLIGQNTTSSTTLQNVFFVLSAEFIYVAAYWLAIGKWPSGNSPYEFLAASIIGAITLMCLYWILLDRKIDLLQGCIYAAITGFFSAIIPIIGIWYDAKLENYWIRWICELSVFLTWQPLFILSLYKAKVAAITAV